MNMNMNLTNHNHMFMYKIYKAPQFRWVATEHQIDCKVALPV